MFSFSNCLPWCKVVDQPIFRGNSSDRCPATHNVLTKVYSSASCQPAATIFLLLQSILSQQSHKFSGVLNGIDQHMWNPADDPMLPPFGHYTPNDTRGKEVSKQAILADVGLPYTNPADTEGMLIEVLPLTAGKQ